MVRCLPLVLAAVVAVTALALPSPIAPVVRAAPLAEDVAGKAEPAPDTREAPSAGAAQTVPSAVGGDIVPGAVNRSSPFLDATYDAYLWLGWGSRKVYVDSTATIRNTSGSDDRPGRAQHHRRTARRDPAGPGDGRRSRRRGHASATRRSWCRSAACCHPAGPPGPGPLHARRCAPASAARTGCSLGRTASSTSIAGCPGSAGGSRSTGPTTAIRSRRRRAGRSRSAIVTTRKLVLATTGDRISVSADGLTQTFGATDVRDFTVTAAHRLPDGLARRARHVVRV